MSVNDRIRGIRQIIKPGFVLGRSGLTKGNAQQVRISSLFSASGIAAAVRANDGTIKGNPVESDNADVTDLALLQFILANGDWEFKSLSQVLDSVLGTTQGAVIYRNSTVWTTLAPSTVGFVLSTNGAGANPSWIAQSGGGGSSSGMLPLVSGDLPGPSLIADASGQCIGVPL